MAFVYVAVRPAEWRGRSFQDSLSFYHQSKHSVRGVHQKTPDVMDERGKGNPVHINTIYMHR